MRIKNIRRLSLLDIAMVCTEKQFSDLCLHSPNVANEYVYLSAMQIRREIRGGVKTGELPVNSIAVVPTNCSAAFLAFLLTSLPYQFLLSHNTLFNKVKFKITRKAVAQLPAFSVDAEAEHVYGVAYTVREQLFKLYKNDENDLSLHHLYNAVADMCDTLILELTIHPLFEEMDVHIYDNWERLVKEFDAHGDIKRLLNGIVKSDSILRNQILKAHIFESNIEKLIKDDIYGMENK